MGPYTQEFEERISELMNVPYVTLTNSGTSALIISLLSIGIKPGDEVILPALTWIATAQAAALLGAHVVLVDCLPRLPIIDIEGVARKITKKTKAIIPVNLNGRACDIKRLKNIAKENNIYIIEDVCKGMFSQNNNCYLGTIGDIGCFSMGMISLLSIGYGGFLVTKNIDLHNKIRLIRDHGVVRNPEEYKYLGANYKVSDLLASIGLGQLDKLQEKIKRVCDIYKIYNEALSENSKCNLLPVDILSGEVPLYVEAYSEQREDLINYLNVNNIGTSRFHLPLHSARYLDSPDNFPCANELSKNAFILPSGPSQSLDNVYKCAELINHWK